MTSKHTESRGARFGCGFVFGLTVGAISGAVVAFSDGGLFLVATLVLAIVSGLAAVRFGDDFWRWVGTWLR